MSTSETKKLHFMIYAPDHTDPEAFQRRLSFRTEHLQRVGTLREEGVLKLGGPTLAPDSVLPGAEEKMNGSLLIAEASSIEEVKGIVERDTYYINDIWNKEKIIITPMIFVPPK